MMAHEPAILLFSGALLLLAAFGAAPELIDDPATVSRSFSSKAAPVEPYPASNVLLPE
jgi:hypothetical protein